MLNYLLIQAGVGFLTFVFAVICINVWKRSKGSVGRNVAVGFGILSIASAVYYFLDVLLWNRYEWSMVGVKIFLFVIAIIVFIMCMGISLDEKEFDFHGGITLFVYFLFILGVLFGLINPTEKDDKYNMNVIEQSPKVQTEQYELIAASDGTNIGGSLSGEVSGSFFLISGTMSSTVNGEIKQTNVYRFYYVANSETGEIRMMTVDADTTAIFLVEEGETPYMLKKVAIPHSIDYNKEPAVNIYYDDKAKVTYELHIPKGSIVGNFEFNAKN